MPVQHKELCMGNVNEYFELFTTHFFTNTKSNKFLNSFNLVLFVFSKFGTFYNIVKKTLSGLLKC